MRFEVVSARLSLTLPCRQGPWPYVIGHLHMTKESGGKLLQIAFVYRQT